MTARFFAIGDGGLLIASERGAGVHVLGAVAAPHVVLARADDGAIADDAGVNNAHVWLYGRSGLLRAWADVRQVAVLADPPRLAVHRIVLGPNNGRWLTPHVEIVDAASGAAIASLTRDVNGAIAWSPDGAVLWLQSGDHVVAVDGGGGGDIGSFAAPQLRGSRDVVFASGDVAPGDLASGDAASDDSAHGDSAHGDSARDDSAHGGGSPTRALVHGDDARCLAYVELDATRGTGRVIGHRPASVRQLVASSTLARAFSLDALGALAAWMNEGDDDGDGLRSKQAGVFGVRRVWCSADASALYALIGDRIVGVRDGRLDTLCAELDQNIEAVAVDADAGLAVEVLYGGARIHDLRLRTSEYVREAAVGVVAHERALAIVNGALFVSDKRTEKAPRVVEGPIGLQNVAAHPRGVVVVDGAGCTHFIDRAEILS